MQGLPLSLDSLTSSIRSEIFALGVVDHYPPEIVLSGNNNLTRPGEHSVQDARVAIVSRLFDLFNRGGVRKPILTAMSLDNRRYILGDMTTEFIVCGILVQFIRNMG